MTSIFLDSNIFIAFANQRDHDHGRYIQLMDQARRGEFGIPYTSDYVFDETVTTALFRTRRLSTAIKAGQIILGSREETIPSFVKLLRVDGKVFNDAWTRFKTGRFPRLSFTDHTILTQIKEYGIDGVLSFDTGFDGLTLRIS